MAMALAMAKNISDSSMKRAICGVTTPYNWNTSVMLLLVLQRTQLTSDYHRLTLAPILRISIRMAMGCLMAGK